MIPQQMRTLATEKDFADAIINYLQSVMNTMKIARIEKFYPETQTADVSILSLRSVPAQNKVGPYPKLMTLPCLFPCDANGGLTFVPHSGDECMVVFADRDITNWLLFGQIDVPKMKRCHDLNDGVAIVGLRNMKSPLADFFNGTRLFSRGDLKIDAMGAADISATSIGIAGSDHVTITADGDGLITVDGSGVNLCGSAFTPEMFAKLASLATAEFDAHTHNAGTLTSPAGPVTGATAIPTPQG
jgi:hypothetical protein